MTPVHHCWIWLWCSIGVGGLMLPLNSSNFQMAPVLVSCGKECKHCRLGILSRWRGHSEGIWTSKVLYVTSIIPSPSCSNPLSLPPFHFFIHSKQSFSIPSLLPSLNLSSYLPSSYSILSQAPSPFSSITIFLPLTPSHVLSSSWHTFVQVKERDLLQSRRLHSPVTACTLC